VLPKLERLYLDDLMRTHDAAEGIDAFLARRPPVWRNE
jgi:enoyl-CoA hydratase/carnithine racemase